MANMQFDAVSGSVFVEKARTGAIENMACANHPNMSKTPDIRAR